MAGPLEGVRVIDITSVIAGPFATMILGDLGATVVKIESPRGDDSRHLGPPFINGTGIPFLGLNRNKQSLSLNLKDPDALEIVYKLAETSDIFLESNRPGTMERLGLGYAAIQQRNPRIIYCSNTPYGTKGPRREEAGYELAIQGYTGIMYRGESTPVRERCSTVDVSTGMTMLYSILAALYAREKTGMGQRIDLSMLGAIMSVQAARFVEGPQDSNSNEHRQGATATYRPYRTQDDWIIVAVLNNNLFRKLSEVLNRPDLPQDPRFSTQALRTTHEKDLAEIIGTTLLEQPAAVWIERLAQTGVPCSPVQPLSALMDDPQMLANDLVTEIDHPEIGTLKAYGVGPKFSATPASVRTPPPMLGEHATAVLTELGYSPSDISTLRAQGALG